MRFSSGPCFDLSLLTCIYVLFCCCPDQGRVSFNSFCYCAYIMINLVCYILLQSSVNSWGGSFNIKSHYRDTLRACQGTIIFER